MNKRPYLICTSPFNSTSAGTKVQHLLCDRINRKGYNAYVQSPVNPNYWTPYIGNFEMIKHMMDNDAIAIYPENVDKNWYEAKEKNIVVYALSKPGLFGGGNPICKNQHVYTYHKVLNRFYDKVNGTLTLPHIELEIFNNPGYDRNIESVYFGKAEGKKIDIPIDISHMETITLNPSYGSREDIAELLKHSKTLYTFDKFTGMIHEALLCGCPVVVFDDGNLETHPMDRGENGIGVPVIEILENTYYGTTGISVGLDDIKIARETVKDFPEIYKKACQMFEEEFDKFLKVSQEY